VSKRTLIARVVAVGTMVISSAVGVGVVPAQATAAEVVCNQGGGNNDPGTLVTNGAVPYRTGPGEVCAALSNRSGTGDIFCSKFNEHGNLWYYVRDRSSGTLGWVWSGNVQSTSGSNHAGCG